MKIKPWEYTSFFSVFSKKKKKQSEEEVIEVLIPAVGSLANVLSKALVMDWNRFIFVVGPGAHT